MESSNTKRTPSFQISIKLKSPATPLVSASAPLSPSLLPSKDLPLLDEAQKENNFLPSPLEKSTVQKPPEPVAEPTAKPETIAPRPPKHFSRFQASLQQLVESNTTSDDEEDDEKLETTDETVKKPQTHLATSVISSFRHQLLLCAENKLLFSPSFSRLPQPLQDQIERDLSCAVLLLTSSLEPALVHVVDTLSTHSIILNSLEAALTILTLMTLENVPQHLLIEESIEKTVRLIHHLLQNVLIPFTECLRDDLFPSTSSSTNNKGNKKGRKVDPDLEQVEADDAADGDWSPTRDSPKESLSLIGKRTTELTNKIADLTERLDLLINRIRLSDAIVISLSFTFLPVFFSEGFDSLQLRSLEILRSVCAPSFFS